MKIMLIELFFSFYLVTSDIFIELNDLEMPFYKINKYNK